MKKQNTKTFIKISLLAISLIFLAQSCGGGKRQEQIELVWWKPFDNPNLIQPLVQEFQKANPNIRITYSEKNIETYEDELLEALASGRGPDIFSIHNDWLPKHIEKAAPAPESVLTLRELKETYLDVINQDFVEKDKIYALPLSMDVLALYYNKDIFASVGIPRPPATWEEVVNLVTKFVVQDSFGNFQRQAIALGTADNINRSPDILGLLMLQNGTPFYSPDRQQSTINLTLRDQEGAPYSPGVRALEFYTQFANPAKLSYTWNNRSNNSIEAFANGQVAMILSYSYLIPTLREKSPFLNYGIATVPQLDPNRSRINFANYWGEAVSKQSTHQEAAWKFLKFITSKDVLKKQYELEKRVAPRIDLVEEQISDPTLGVFAENALSAKSFYKPDSDAVDSIFAQMINDVVLRSITPQEAVNAAVQKINLLTRKQLR